MHAGIADAVTTCHGFLQLECACSVAPWGFGGCARITHTNTLIHARIHTLDTHRHTRTHTYMHAHTHTHTRTHAYTHQTHTRAHRDRQIHIHMCETLWNPLRPKALMHALTRAKNARTVQFGCGVR